MADYSRPIVHPKVQTIFCHFLSRHIQIQHKNCDLSALPLWCSIKRRNQWKTCVCVEINIGACTFGINKTKRKIEKENCGKPFRSQGRQKRQCRTTKWNWNDGINTLAVECPQHTENIEIKSRLTSEKPETVKFMFERPYGDIVPARDNTYKMWLHQIKTQCSNDEPANTQNTPAPSSSLILTLQHHSHHEQQQQQKNIYK